MVDPVLLACVHMSVQLLPVAVLFGGCLRKLQYLELAKVVVVFAILLLLVRCKTGEGEGEMVLGLLRELLHAVAWRVHVEEVWFGGVGGRRGVAVLEVRRLGRGGLSFGLVLLHDGRSVGTRPGLCSTRSPPLSRVFVNPPLLDGPVPSPTCTTIDRQQLAAEGVADHSTWLAMGRGLELRQDLFN